MRENESKKICVIKRETKKSKEEFYVCLCYLSACSSSSVEGIRLRSSTLVKIPARTVGETLEEIKPTY